MIRSQTDQTAFQTLHAKYLGISRHYLRGLLRGQWQRIQDDILQCVWINIFETRHQYSGPSFAPHMYNVIHNTVLDEIRREKASTGQTVG